MRKYFFIITIFFIAGSALGQDRPEPDKGGSSEGNNLFYRSEIYGGAFLHTNGLGISIRKTQRITGYSKKVYGLELLNLKHAKEFKSYNSYYENNRGFVYGKLNSVVVARPHYGYQKIWFTKDAKKGVQISYVVQGGPTIGFLKPVYLEINETSSGSRVVKTEKFDPEEHSYSNIFGRAPILKGIEETELMAGLHAKASLNFEYANDDDLYRAVEAGIALDAFTGKVPIMAFETNRQLYFTLFVGFHFGRKFI